MVSSNDPFHADGRITIRADTWIFFPRIDTAAKQLPDTALYVRGVVRLSAMRAFNDADAGSATINQLHDQQHFWNEIGHLVFRIE